MISLPKNYRSVLEIIEIAEAALDRATFFTNVCDKLSTTIGFTSAILVPHDPKTLDIQPDGHLLLNARSKESMLFVEYYAPLDPLYTEWLVKPENVNTTERNTDLVSPRRLDDCEFGRDFLPKVPAFYVVGGLLGWRGGVFGGFALHRTKSCPNFTDRDEMFLNAVAPHLACALHHLDVIEKVKTSEEDTLPIRMRSFDLTKSQKAVASLILEGLSNKQIATRLFITEQTVKDHLHDIFRKLRVSSRTELVLRLLRPGSKKQNETDSQSEHRYETREFHLDTSKGLSGHS